MPAVVWVIASHPAWVMGVALLFGLSVGSFLNVVIHRLPARLQFEWAAQCRTFLALDPDAGEPPPGLAFPASHCPHCRAPLKAYDNLPIVSYLVLRGRCRACKQPISLRYPLIEALTALLTVVDVWHFGLTWQLVCALLLTWTLIAAAGIDADTQLLPDVLTLPLLWAGLLVNCTGLFVPLPDAVVGAVAGYLALWLTFHLFRLATGKEGMGYGDFKLLAAGGAWLGWQGLPIVILVASGVGALVGLTLIALKRHARSAPMPFGPYLAGALWVALLWAPAANDLYLRWAA